MFLPTGKRSTRGYDEHMRERLNRLAADAAELAASLGDRAWRRVRRPVLFLVGGIVLLMLLIVVLQSGLGVDSDDTITDSQRPEIVGGE